MCTDILMNKESHRPLAIQVSKALNCRVLSVSYRLAPESPFPGGLHDAVASYLYLTQGPSLILFKGLPRII